MWNKVSDEVMQQRKLAQYFKKFMKAGQGPRRAKHNAKLVVMVGPYATMKPAPK